MEKQNACVHVCVCMKILGLEEEGHSDTFSGVDEPGGRGAEWNEPHTKGHTVGFPYWEGLRGVQATETERRLWAPAWGKFGGIHRQVGSSSLLSSSDPTRAWAPHTSLLPRGSPTPRATEVLSSTEPPDPPCLSGAVPLLGLLRSLGLRTWRAQHGAGTRGAAGHSAWRLASQASSPWPASLHPGACAFIH